MRSNNKILWASLLLGLVLAGCSSPDEKESKYLKRGNELFDKGEYEKARVEYKNASRIKPADAEVIYRIGLVDEAEGNIRGAFADFGHAEEQNAHFHPALLKLAEYYLAEQQYDQVQNRINTVLADTPDDPEAHALKAALLTRQKDFSNAEKEGLFVLAKDPSSVSGYSALAGLYATEGDFNKAEKTIEDGIARNPKSLGLYLVKAGLYDHTHNLDKVNEAYQEIFKLKPKESHFRSELANIYLKAGQVNDAEAVLRAGITALPDDWGMKRQFVAFLGEQHGVDVAEKQIRDYMQAYPDQDDLTAWLIDLYVRHNAVDRATAFLNQIIDKNQFDKEGLNARTALARIDYIQGNKDAAAKLVEIVLEKDANNLDGLFVRANLNFDKGAYQDTVNDLHTIIRERPKSKDALRLLGETLLIQGHLDLAIDTMNHLLELDPVDPAIRTRLAQMVHLHGDSKHAMDLLFIVTKTAPQYPLGWEATARIAIDMKDWSTAQMAIDTLDTFEGQHMTAALLRGEVLTSTDKVKDGIAQYVKVISADPSSPLAELAFRALANAYKSLGRLDEGVRYIESVKTHSPVVSTLLGECYLDLDKADLAGTAFDAAIANNVRNQDPYLYRAKIFLDNNKNDQAMDVLKKATVAVPNDPRAEILEAQTLGRLGHYQEAVALYNDLLAHNPTLDVVANNMAEIIADYEYTDAAQLEKARQVAERFVASPNPLLLDTLSWVYYRQGNIQGAQTVMERVMTTGAKLPPEVHYHYGAILVKEGKINEGKAELQQAIANNPKLDDAKKLLTELH